MPTVYYAHCMAIYDTEQEKRDIATLEALGLTVYNPNNSDVQETVQLMKAQGSTDYMGFFKDLVYDCDVFAFRGLPMTLTLPGGVAKELEWATQAGKPIIELPTLLRESMDHPRSVQYLKEAGER